MPSNDRQRFERPSLRKRAVTVAKETASQKAMLFSRRIVDSQPQGLIATDSFSEALAAPTPESPATADAGSITQVVITQSTPELLAEIASNWDLHPVLVDDLFHANQRAKVERYGDVLFVVLKSAVYIDAK